MGSRKKAIRSNFHTLQTVKGGGGMPTEGVRSEGFSSPKDKKDTDSQPYLTMPYTS
jgi:hypothetical protein